MLITNRITLHNLNTQDRLVFLTDELFKHSLVPAKEFEEIAKDGYDVSYVVRNGKKLVASFIYADLFLPVNETVYLICKKYGLEYCMWEKLQEFPEKATFRPVYLCTEKQFHYFEEKKPKKATKSLPKENIDRINFILGNIKNHGGRYGTEDTIVAPVSKNTEIIEETLLDNHFLKEYKDYLRETSKVRKDESF